MPRFAPARAWFLALVSIPACSDPPAPSPTKLSESPSALEPARPPKRPGDSPFRNPEFETPPPRSDPQLAPDELVKALAASAEALKNGDEVTATLELLPCANKIPQSARCEGELAMRMIGKKSRYTEARYYAAEVLAVDDPDLDDAFYRRFGAAMMTVGEVDKAAVAFQRMIDRVKPTAADWYLLSTALQGLPDRKQDAADAAAKAFAQDPSQLEWLRSEAILLAQVPDKTAQSIALFEQYKARIKDPELLADTDRRIAELRTLVPPVAEAASKQPKPQRGPT